MGRKRKHQDKKPREESAQRNAKLNRRSESTTNQSTDIDNVETAEKLTTDQDVATYSKRLRNLARCKIFGPNPLNLYVTNMTLEESDGLLRIRPEDPPFIQTLAECMKKDGVQHARMNLRACILIAEGEDVASPHALFKLQDEIENGGRSVIIWSGRQRFRAAQLYDRMMGHTGTNRTKMRMEFYNCDGMNLTDVLCIGSRDNGEEVDWPKLPPSFWDHVEIVRRLILAVSWDIKENTVNIRGVDLVRGMFADEVDQQLKSIQIAVENKDKYHGVFYKEFYHRLGKEAQVALGMLNYSVKHTLDYIRIMKLISLLSTEQFTRVRTLHDHLASREKSGLRGYAIPAFFKSLFGRKGRAIKQHLNFAMAGVEKAIQEITSLGSAENFSTDVITRECDRYYRAVVSSEKASMSKGKNSSLPTTTAPVNEDPSTTQADAHVPSVSSGITATENNAEKVSSQEMRVTRSRDPARVSTVNHDSSNPNRGLSLLKQQVRKPKRSKSTRGGTVAPATKRDLPQQASQTAEMVFLADQPLTNAHPDILQSLRPNCLEGLRALYDLILSHLELKSELRKIEDLYHGADETQWQTIFPKSRNM